MEGIWDEKVTDKHVLGCGDKYCRMLDTKRRMLVKDAFYGQDLECWSFICLAGGCIFSELLLRWETGMTKVSQPLFISTNMNTQVFIPWEYHTARHFPPSWAHPCFPVPLTPGTGAEYTTALLPASWGSSATLFCLCFNAALLGFLLLASTKLCSSNRWGDCPTMDGAELSP